LIDAINIGISDHLGVGTSEQYPDSDTIFETEDKQRAALFALANYWVRREHFPPGASDRAIDICSECDCNKINDYFMRIYQRFKLTGEFRICRGDFGPYEEHRVSQCENFYEGRESGVTEDTAVIVTQPECKTVSVKPKGSVNLRSIEEAMDDDDNNIIDDPEILKALRYWISGEEVPGTGGQTIDDAKMLELLHIWTSRRPISSASAQSRPIQIGRAESLTVREIKLSPNPVKSTYTATFRAEGSGIAGLKVEVFNLAGMKVSEEEASGNTLKFYALDDRGRPLANGVYLYVVTVRGFNGEAIRSEIRKLVILR
jgi:hypothetical protein